LTGLFLYIKNDCKYILFESTQLSETDEG